MKKVRNMKKFIKEYREEFLKKWDYKSWFLFYKYVKVWVKE